MFICLFNGAVSNFQFINRRMRNYNVIVMNEDGTGCGRIAVSQYRLWNFNAVTEES
jgi:hypothetical protein